MVELERFEDAVSERMAQLEQEDLERYQRDVDSQRRIVRMRRPIQRFEMRVPDYYQRFCYWKEDMISVGYPDDESSYIDDFIGNLQWHIQLRVSNRRSRLSRLVDAYYEAKFEETTILLERMVKDLKAANDIDEIADQTTIEIQRDDGICISVEEESTENNQQAKPYVETQKANVAEPYAHKSFDGMPRSLSIELKEEDGDSDGAEIYDEHPDEEIQSNDYAMKGAEVGNHFTDKLLPNSFVKYEETELDAGNDCVVLGELAAQIDADKVYVEMTEPVLEDDLLGNGVTKTTHYMLNGRLMLSPTDSGLLTNISKGTAQNLSYADGVLGDGITKFSLLSKLDFNPQVFDPGTLKSSKLEEYESQLQCISSEPFPIYSQVYGAFNAYKHLVIVFCCCLFQRAWSRNSNFYWALSMWNSREVLLWNCSVPLWKYIITGAYISISTHGIANCHVGALAQMCITYGHDISAGNANAHFTATVMPVRAHKDSFSKSLCKGVNSLLLRKILYGRTLSLDELKVELRLVSRNAVVCISRRDTRPLLGKSQQMFVFAFKGIIPSPWHANSFIDVVLEMMFGEMVLFLFDPGIGSLHLTGCAPLYSSEMPGSFIVALWLSKVPFYFNPDGYLFNNYCDHSLNRDVPIQVFIGEKVMSVVKMISCWILIYDGWIYSLGLAIIYGTCLSCLSPLKADFAWDPGICAISIYILEDKDVLKRVGNRILVTVMIRSIRDGQIKIHVICIEEGFGSMTTWRNGTICASTIFPGNLVLDRHSEVPQLLDKTGPPPTGLRPPFTLFSSVEDYYIDSMLRDALDDAPKADKMPINGLGESYSTQNRGLGIDQWLFDEMAESFPIKLKSCVGPNKDLRLSVATLLLQLNIKFWLDVISIFGFYPGTGANEDQWNAYKGHVNMRCIVAVPFGIIDHLVFFLGGCLFRPFDPGGCLFPQIDCDPFESNVPTKGQVSTLAVLVLYMFYLEVIRQRGYIHGTMQSRFSIDPQLIIMQSRCPTNLQLIFGCHLMILHMRIFVNSHYCVCNMLFCIVMISNIKDEVFCQLKIWKSFPILQMSMKVESDKQHLGFWFDDKVPCICQKSTLLLALFPVSCDYYSMLQCHIKMQRPAARSAPKMQGKITTAAILLLFSIIFGISRFMSCALLPYANALAGWLGIYKFNESAAISKMLYGIPVFVFQPP